MCGLYSIALCYPQGEEGAFLSSAVLKDEEQFVSAVKYLIQNIPQCCNNIPLLTDTLDWFKHTS